MRPTHKIPELIDPHALNTTNGQEAWRVLGIMAEFAIATERLRGLRPAVSMFGSARIKSGHAYYEKANRAPGVTGELLIQQLERRLDNVAYRLGFAISRRQARQVVRHGHVQVNGKKVNIPSFQVNAGDEISIREGAKKLIIVEQGVQYAAQNPAPSWLEVNFENMSGRVLHLPRRQDVNLPINEQLIVELYSK